MVGSSGGSGAASPAASPGTNRREENDMDLPGWDRVRTGAYDSPEHGWAPASSRSSRTPGTIASPLPIGRSARSLLED